MPTIMFAVEVSATRVERRTGVSRRAGATAAETVNRQLVWERMS
jgi:hypothetical protein